MPNKTETRRLPVELTELQINEIGTQLAANCIEKAVVEGQKADANKRFKAIIDRLDSEIAYQSQVVADGVEQRDVQCHWEIDTIDRVKILYRDDTEEQIQTAQLEDGEYQEELPLDVECPEKEERKQISDYEDDSNEEENW